MGSHSAITFRPLWALVGNWKCYFYITDGWPVYPMFIPDGDQIICKTYMIRVEGENTRLRHYLARLHRKTLCYSKSGEMLKHSIRLVISFPVASELLAQIRTRQCRVPTILFSVGTRHCRVLYIIPVQPEWIL